MQGNTQDQMYEVVDEQRPAVEDTLDLRMKQNEAYGQINPSPIFKAQS